MGPKKVNKDPKKANKDDALPAGNRQIGESSSESIVTGFENKLRVLFMEAKKDDTSFEEILSVITSTLTNVLLQVMNKFKEITEVNSTTIEQLQYKVDVLEQRDRSNNVRIYGLDVRPNMEVEEAVVKLVNEKLKLDFSAKDIDRAHYIGSYSSKTKHVIVRLSNFKTKVAIFGAKKLLKNSGVVISEDLTKVRYQLYQEAVKYYGRSRVWSNYGKIVIKIGDSKNYFTSFANYEDFKRENKAEDVMDGNA